MSLIVEAVRLLRAGRLVAFPTETVYGLGADATNAAAVRRIFQAKGRPPTNPLIVHVAGVMVARHFAARWPHQARLLTQAFWPGPLTIVLPKMPQIVDEVTAGLPTVGLRMPDHRLALELLRKFEGPVAAPSANRSNHVSPTTAEHVRQELGDSVDLIVDGGPCDVGIESTVLDLSGAEPVILRPGGITREQIEKLIGPVSERHELTPASEPARAPGQLPKHYAPRTPAFRFEGKLPVAAPSGAAGWILIGDDDEVHRADARRVSLPCDSEGYARHFYAILRELDDKDLKALYVQMPPDTPVWRAVRDRIIRATLPL